MAHFEYNEDNAKLKKASENLAKNSIDAEYIQYILQDKCSVGAVGVWYIEKYRQNMQSGASL